MELRPAWSWQFESGTLAAIKVLGLPSPPTREWAWGGATGAGVRVAIIDSGIDADHPSVGGIAGGAVIDYDPDASDLVRITEGPHSDLFGHGTACAGIIRKTAPEADLFSIRVLGEKLTGKGFAFVAGLKWAIANRMQVVNMSLSTGKRDYFDIFHEVADAAYFQHIMLVCAVNNVPKPSYPSQYSSVFSVAANDGKDPFEFHYNPEPPVEFGAPGIDVEVAWADKTMITATGNSFAAPHIAGLIARILSKHQGLTPFQMKTLLHSLANNAVSA